MRTKITTIALFFIFFILGQSGGEFGFSEDEQSASETKEEKATSSDEKPAVQEEQKESVKEKQPQEVEKKAESKEEVKSEPIVEAVKDDTKKEEEPKVEQVVPTAQQQTSAETDKIVPIEKKEEVLPPQQVVTPEVVQPPPDKKEEEKIPVLEKAVETPLKIEKKEVPLAPPKTLVNTKNMVFIPEGEFSMGIDKSLWIDDATPKRKVFISAFYLDKFEVSFEEYQRCVNASKCKPSKYAKKSKFNKSLLPVIGVNWTDAKVFCEWLGKRLPTEAEWEKSARGAEERKYTWGEKFSIYAPEKFANVYGKYDDFFLTAPVDSFPNGASPFGVFNMNGNVREWVFDWYDPEYYREKSNKDPQGPEDGKYKVVRGGSYKNTPPKISNTYRDYEKPTKTTKDVGFRCALSESK